ncbi:3-hydroxybutyrate dehydrogenase [soil metagenome]
MQKSLTGKTALITGSTSGLGKGIADTLAASGCRIVLNGFGDEAEIEALQNDLCARHGVEVIHHGANLTRPEEIAELFEQALSRFGTVDILVNNAGVQHVAPIEDFPHDKWDTILALNLTAAFHCTKAVLPGMRQRHWGRIINIASAHGLVASPFKAAYVAAKHGLVGLTKVTALETARDHITCNAICPGYVHTKIVEGQIDEQARVTGLPREKVVEEVILSKHPNKKFVEVGQVAALVDFLCSDAGASMTGTALPMDGGWTAI